MATILDGKALAARVKARVGEAAKKLPRRPGLAVLLVGEDPASKVYVRGKERDLSDCGFLSFGEQLPADIPQEELISRIEALNLDERVDGILVQLPLPGQLNEKAVLRAISPEKDVDCFHPQNVGLLSIGEPGFLPCTPAGVMELLRPSTTQRFPATGIS